MDRIFKELLLASFETFLEKCFAELLPGDRFIAAKHIRAICWQLRHVLEGKTRRLIINLPPRCLKSIIVSVALPAWILGHDPTRRIICVSYNEELARRHAANFRRIVTAHWFRRLFPRFVITKETDRLITTSRGGFRMATSVGGTLTGLGGHYILIDDPIKADEIPSRTERARTIEWYKNTLSTRRDDPATGVIILLQQRLHTQDLSGFLLERPGWTHLRLPAISDGDQLIQIDEREVWHFKENDLLDPARLTAAYLQERQEEQGPFLFRAQFLQAPVPPDGNVFKADWLREFDLPGFDCRVGEVVQCWDVASKPGASNDYSVCITAIVRPTGFYVIDVTRVKVEFPQLQHLAVELAGRYRANRVLVEDSSSGTALLQVLRQRTSLNAIPIKPTKEKEVRAIRSTASFEAGRIHFARNATWLGALEQELLEFPAGRHDDQVDALVHLVNWFENRRRPTVSLYGPIIIQG